jgi:hypothetical protein
MCATIEEIDATAHHNGNCGLTAARSGQTGTSYTATRTSCEMIDMIAARMCATTGATGVMHGEIKRD